MSVLEVYCTMKILIERVCVPNDSCAFDSMYAGGFRFASVVLCFHDWIPCNATEFTVISTSVEEMQQRREQFRKSVFIHTDPFFMYLCCTKVLLKVFGSTQTYSTAKS